MPDTPDASAPVAPHRVGHPAPLVLHVGAAAAAYSHAVATAPMARQYPWHPDAIGPSDPPAALQVAGEAGARMQAMLDGIARWQRHPARRELADPPTVWQDGSSRLLDYGQTDPAGRHGFPLLVIPSLINRAYVLDLAPGRSFLRFLAASGLRPLLLDWGPPGAAERDFDLDTYTRRRLLPALNVAGTLGGDVPAVMGYCMGGTLATGLAATPGTEMSALVTVGAPWRFAGGRGAAADARRMLRLAGASAARQYLAGIAAPNGLVPVDLFDWLFALVDPMQAAGKFRRFATADPDSPAARHFVLLEDWLADGVPMALPTAQDLLVGWMLRNLPAAGRWSFLGEAVSLRRIDCPTLVVTGRRDTIAPPAMAVPLAERIPDAEHIALPLGHVGMIAGSRAEAMCWQAVVAFLARTL